MKLQEKIYDIQINVQKSLSNLIDRVRPTLLPITKPQSANLMEFLAQPSAKNTTTQPQISALEQQINRNIIVASTTLGLHIIGNLGFPIFILLSAPGYMYIATSHTQDAWNYWKKTRRIGVAFSDTVGISIVPLVGYGIPVIAFNTALFISHKILLRTRQQSHQKLVNIFGETPRNVWIKRGDVDVQVPFESLSINDLVVVHAGEIIPADGTIVAGMASVDQQRLTGESQPLDFAPNDEVLAATIVLSGQITFRVQKAGAETITAQIGAILNRTVEYRSPLEFEGEKLANQSIIPVYIAGLLSVPFIGLARALAITIANPGYHLRVTAPISLLNYLKRATTNGVLIKDGRAMEQLSKVDIVVFDKTGTLTEGVPFVSAIYACDGYDKDTVLEYAAAAEYRQPHPIALAILQAAESQKIQLPQIKDASYQIGYGIQAVYSEQKISVGSHKFMRMLSIEISVEFEELYKQCADAGESLVYVAIDNQICGVIELQPTIRPEAAHIVQELQARNIEVAIISGDQQAPTRQLASQIGVDLYYAEILPEQKAQMVAQLQQQGKTVCFVGDGINDAVALQQADISISLRGASSIAMDTAEIILMDGNLEKLILLFDLGNELENNMSVNKVMSITPATLSMLGVYLAGFTITTSLALNYVFFNLGITNAMLPLWRPRIKDKEVAHITDSPRRLKKNHDVR